MPMARDVVTIGTFDGVHLGHQKVLAAARAAATAREARCTAYAFDVPPRAVAEEEEPQLLLPPATKRHLLGHWVDRVIEPAFDDVRDLEAVSFVRDVLARELDAGVVVVGASFRFARHRVGDVSTLVNLAAPLGLAISVVPSFCVGGAPVSSTRIRALLTSGAVEEAASLLGRPPLLRGPVVPGDGIGRTLEFPTANLMLDRRVLLPRHGVYLSRAFVGHAWSFALTYVGLRPTLGESSLRCEVHWLLPPPHRLEGETLEVHLVSLLRPDRAFASLSDLRQQMEVDRAAATRAAAAYPVSSDPHPFGG